MKFCVRIMLFSILLSFAHLASGQASPDVMMGNQLAGNMQWVKPDQKISRVSTQPKKNPRKKQKAGSTLGGSAVSNKTSLGSSTDLPLGKLIEFVVADLNRYWGKVFAAAGLRYRPPTKVQGYTAEISTACGKTLKRNAFYCPASHSIHYDSTFFSELYHSKELGDFAVAAILAHEWGHLVQFNLDATGGAFFSIQKELQADCLCGAYALEAHEKNYLDDGDLDEGTLMLFKVGDRKGTPWFDPEAHGRSYQRVNSFLEGLKGGPFACGFTASLVGVWQAETMETGIPTRITWVINANGTSAYSFGSAFGVSSGYQGFWKYQDGKIYEEWQGGFSGSGVLRWIDANHFELTIERNQDPTSAGRVRKYYRVKR